MWSAQGGTIGGVASHSATGGVFTVAGDDGGEQAAAARLALVEIRSGIGLLRISNNRQRSFCLSGARAFDGESHNGGVFYWLVVR